MQQFRNNAVWGRAMVTGQKSDTIWGASSYWMLSKRWGRVIIFMLFKMKYIGINYLNANKVVGDVSPLLVITPPRWRWKSLLL